MADTAGIRNQRHTASFFADFGKFCKITDLQHRWMQQIFGIFFFHNNLLPDMYI